MSTRVPGPFTERGDQAEAAAFRGDGVYSGGEFAGGEPERYDDLSGGSEGDDVLDADTSSRSGTDSASTDLQTRSPGPDADGVSDRPDRS